MKSLTDAEFDMLIAEVEQDIVNLAKSQDASKKLEKALPGELEEEQNDMPAEMAAPEAPAEQAAPEMEASPEAPAEELAPEAPLEELAPEMEASPEMEDDSMDLDSIYSAMDEQELAEHYEAIKRAMEAAWSQQAPEQEQAPEMEAAPMELSEDDVQKTSILDKDSEEANGGDMKAGADMAKSEKSDEEKAALEQKLEEMKKSQEDLQSALEKLIKTASNGLPMRKAVTEITTKPQEPELSGDNLKKKALEITSQSLSKSERDMLNTWFIDGSNEKDVKELVKAKKA